jgi:iron complex outermembrane receptor protein
MSARPAASPRVAAASALPVLAALLVIWAAQTAGAQTSHPAGIPVPTSEAGDFPMTPGGVPSTAPGIGNPAPPPSGEDSPELLLFKDIPIVVAAGKREQTEQQAPASVSIVTAQDIDLFGYRSLADVLRNQRSFYLGTDGLNWFAGVRGFLRPGEWNSRLMVTVDGRPTNDIIFGQSHLDQDFVLPMEAVKQIEIIRGPGSALYGSNAVFGVINLVPKTGADINGVEARLTGGTQETGRASVLFGHAFDDGWDIVAGATGYTSQGDNDIVFSGVNDAAHDFGHIRGADYEGAESGFIRARKGDFSIMADIENRIKDNRDATYDASFYNPGTMHEQRENLTLRYDHEINIDQSIHAMAFYGRYAYDQFFWLQQDAIPPIYKYTTDAYDDWLGEEVHYDWQATQKLHLLLGADGKEAIDTRQHDFDTIDGNLIDVPASYSAWGIFGEAEYKYTDFLSFTGGLRLDGVQRIQRTVSPRFAVVLNATHQDTIKALYGRAFRAPNLYEEIYNAPGNVPNPNLRPEIADTFEVVWERQFQSGWRTSLDGYVWKMADAMEDFTLANGYVQTRNGPTLWAHGIEAEVSRRWANGGSFRSYVTFSRAEHDSVTLEQSPQWIAGIAAVAPVYKDRVFLSVEPQYVGRMKSVTGEFVSPTFLTNVVLTANNLAPTWDLQGGIYGLFANSAHLPSGGSFEQFEPVLNYPRTRFLLTLTHRF